MTNPTYKEVCTGTTGHAEVVQVEFDPSVVNYEELLKVFFENHDPTTPNRQGPNRGSQYRSIIFYHSLKQKELIEDMVDEINASGYFKTPVVTEIVEEKPFYRAEEYHQRYYEKHRNIY